DERRRHAAPRGECVEREPLAVVGVLAQLGGDGRGEVGIGPAELSPHDAPDRRERESFLLQGAHLADPLRMLGPVPGHSPLALGGGKQSEGLVVAHGVHRHAGPRCQLLDAIPHDSPLYECALEGSTGRSRGRPGYDAGAVETLKRPVGLGLALFCLAITLTVSTAWKGYCANGVWTDGRQYHTLCYSDIVPLFDQEQLAGDRLPYLDTCASTPDAPCDEYPALSMYFMRIAAWLGGPTHPGFFYA